MKWLDKFVDTYDKRSLVLFVLIEGLLIYFCINNIILASKLYQIKEINDLYSLINLNNNSLLRRTIVTILNYSNTQIGTFGLMFIIIDAAHITYFIAVILDFFGQRNKLVYYSFIFQLIFYVLLLIVLGIILSTTSIVVVLSYLHIISVIYLITQIGLLLINTGGLFLKLNQTCYNA